ncbi:hypothetical protein SLS54_006616 [Diplodia seriata]
MELSHVYGVELSRLRNLCSEPQPLRKIHFRLESDTLPARESYLDLYVPEFHQYGSSIDRPVRHLDITSTWRKLSTTHAAELKFWEDMFAAVLEYTISNHLIDLVDDMHDCNIDRYPGDLDGRICAFVNKLGGRTFPVNVREIATCMLELYERHGCQHQWFASSGNLYNALCEFLRTRDCFLDAPLHPTIKVTFAASFSPQNEPAVVGVLRRFGPVMGFTRLDAFTTEDAWCEIHPTYVEPTLDPNYASFLKRPEYRLASDWVKFDWDSGVQGFRGYVRPMPSLGAAGVRTCLNVDLAAVSRRVFPDGVVFERNLRVRIKLYTAKLATKMNDDGRTDSVLDTSSDQKRPVSTVWISTDDTTAATSHKSSGTVDNTAWVRWSNGDDEGLGGLSHMEEQWYMPPGDQIERAERLGRSIKEWYDAMLLKRDTPRKKTREEQSQEEAFEEAFLGGDSGEDGDIEGDD